MIRNCGPPAARNCLTILVRFLVAPGMFALTQPVGSGCVGQPSTSLPPIEIVTILTWLRWLLMKSTAACVWLLPGELGAPGASARGGRGGGTPLRGGGQQRRLRPPPPPEMDELRVPALGGGERHQLISWA